MFIEFFKSLIKNILSNPATTLTSLLTGIALILAQGEIIVPVDMKDTVTVIAAIIASIVLFFSKKVGVSITEAKTSMAMRPTGNDNGGR